MAKYDLTNKIGQYLDRHLVAPLLEFLAAQNVRRRASKFRIN
jgi:translation initiation factor 3 subunit E